MIARLLISESLDIIKEKIAETLASHFSVGTVNNPDLLYVQAGEKLGIAEAKKIKEFFSLKPYSAKGKAVVLEDAAALTEEAQSALLKTIEELSREAILILGARSDANLLPTILSRCEIVNLETTGDETLEYHRKYTKDLEKLLNASIEERFGFIEKLKEKEEFLHDMVHYFRKQLLHSGSRQTLKSFLEELLRSEKWARQNVNIRAILEYLMLVMPRGK